MSGKTLWWHRAFPGLVWSRKHKYWRAPRSGWARRESWEGGGERWERKVGSMKALEIGKRVPNQTAGYSLVSIAITEQCRLVFSCNLEGAGRQPAWPAEPQIFPRIERSSGLWRYLIIENWRFWGGARTGLSWEGAEPGPWRQNANMAPERLRSRALSAFKFRGFMLRGWVGRVAGGVGGESQGQRLPCGAAGWAAHRDGTWSLALKWQRPWESSKKRRGSGDAFLDSPTRTRQVSPGRDEALLHLPNSRRSGDRFRSIRILARCLGALCPLSLFLCGRGIPASLLTWLRRQRMRDLGKPIACQ